MPSNLVGILSSAGRAVSFVCGAFCCLRGHGGCSEALVHNQITTAVMKFVSCLAAQPWVCTCNTNFSGRCNCHNSGHYSASETSCFTQRTGRWIMSRTVILILIYDRHKPIGRINLLGS
jgi:hypothetical protein